MSRIKNEIKHFSELEHIWWGARSYAGQRRYENKYKRFIAMCKPKSGAKVLEIGGGDGEFTRRLAKNKHINVLSTDLTPEVIQRARKIFSKNKKIKFSVSNAERMRYKNNSFDIICGVSILHHLNWRKSLKECLRLLRDGGQIFFTEPNYLNPFIFLCLHSKTLRKKYEYSPDEQAIVRWEMAKYLVKLGFREVNVLNYDFLLPSTPKKYVRPVERLSDMLEKLPLIKEVSESVIIYAKK